MADSRSKQAQSKTSARKGTSTSRSRVAEPEPGIFEAHRADLIALALATLAILSALAVWFDALGPVGKGVTSVLGLLLGTIRYLFPVLLVAGGVILLVNREKAETTRLWVGGGLGLLALCGLAGLTGGTPGFGASHHDLEGAGGYFGVLIGHTLGKALGTIGAAVLLVAVLVVGAIVATGIPLRTALPFLSKGAKHGGSAAAKWWSGASFRSRRAASSEADDAAVTPEKIAPIIPPVSEPPKAIEPEPAALTMVADEEPVEMVAPVPAKPKRASKAPVAAKGGWILPPADLLKRTVAQRHDQNLVDQAGADLVAALGAHGVETTLVGCTVGPTVTRYELELGPGVKVARVTSLSKDIAYAMASPDVRILAPIPGRSAIGVEVPNRQRQLVTLGDLLSSSEAAETTDPLAVALGRDIAGRTVMQSLAEFPHVLISGATGAGKSSAINSLITSIAMRTTPDEVKLILVDPKRVELGQYNDLPHLMSPVVVDPKKAANALSWAVKEMERRYDLLAAHGVRDISSYHEALDAGQLSPIGPPDDSAAIAAIADRAKATAAGVPFDAEAIDHESTEDFERLAFVVIVVDELNDLMMVAARDVEESVVRIAQMARAVGIHLVLATQRPSVDVITGVIKANVPSRMAFSVSSLADSRVILDQPGAERLVGKGDMLLLTASSNVARRIQAPWVSEEEVRDVVAFWRAQGGQRELVVAIGGGEVDPITASSGSGGAGGDDDDELLAQARQIVISNQLGSTSMLQRKLRVGFARAGRLMDLLEQEGVVGPSTGSKARAVLISADDLDPLA